jgi:hypothetical protein
VINHAHIEQNTKIAATDEIVMNKLNPRLFKKPLEVIAFT